MRRLCVACGVNRERSSLKKDNDADGDEDDGDDEDDEEDDDLFG